MAISWPIFQAQLQRLQRNSPPPAVTVPDVSQLVYQGIKGFGDNIVAAGERRTAEDLKRQQLAIQQQEADALEAYRQSQAALAKQKLANETKQFDAYGSMAKELEGLYGAGAPAGAAGGPGRGGDASSARSGLPSFVRSGGAMSDMDSATRIYNKFVERGIEPHVAAGVVGQMGPESSFNPSAVGDNGTAFGFVQMRGDRARRLFGEARKKGVPWHDEDHQIDAIVAEFKGPENAAYEAARKATTASEAAAILAAKYERPAKWALRQTLPERMALAEAVARTPGVPAVEDAAPPPVVPTSRVASLDPTAGLVPPPMQGTPAPPPVPQQGPPPTQPPPKPPEAQLKGPPLFGATSQPMMMPGTTPAPAPPPAPSPQAPTAQAGGVREVIPPQTQVPNRQDPRLLRILGSALRTGDPAAIRAAEAAIGLVAPEPKSRYTSTELGILDNQTGRVVAPPGAADGTQPLFAGNSVEGQALNELVKRKILTAEQALEIAAGKLVGAPGGAQDFVSPQALVGAVPPAAPVGALGRGPAAAPAGGPPAATTTPGVRRVIEPSGKPDIPSGELAARIGLGNEFLAVGVPRINQLLKQNVLGDGKTIDPIARAKYFAGVEEPGEIKELLDAGADALLRNLTGAGMSNQEAARYAGRYGFRPYIDSIKDLRRRLKMLSNHLIRTRDAVLAGRKVTEQDLKGWEKEVQSGEDEFEEVKP